MWTRSSTIAALSFGPVGPVTTQSSGVQPSRREHVCGHASRERAPVARPQVDAAQVRELPRRARGGGAVNGHSGGTGGLICTGY